jgi:hypothetical protein
MSDFLSLVQNNGVLGLVVGFIVLIVVYLLSIGGVVATKGQKQAANAVLSIMLAGVSLLNPDSSDVIVASIASIFSALAYEFIRFLGAAQAKAKQAKALTTPAVTSAK